MCSEIDRFSSFLRRMSGKPHQIFADGEERITISESLDSHQTAAEEREKENLEGEDQDKDKDKDKDKGDHRKQPEEIKTNEDERDKATASQRESDAVDDEDDGFKTPTSSDHRIPAIKHCPPAPMKPRPPPPRLKRKASSPPQSYAEIESMFSSTAHDQDDHKNKKARNHDDKDRS